MRCGATDSHRGLKREAGREGADDDLPRSAATREEIRGLGAEADTDDATRRNMMAMMLTGVSTSLLLFRFSKPSLCWHAPGDRIRACR
jgi:hypothetical protein